MKNFASAGRVVERLAGLTSIARIKEFCDAKAAGVRNGVRPDCLLFFKIERRACRPPKIFTE
jgi:hypothetical protein